MLASSLKPSKLYYVLYGSMASCLYGYPPDFELNHTISPDDVELGGYLLFINSN